MTRALVLAAGQGQRLKPLTDDRPKAMVTVAGRPIIEHQLALFGRVGIRDVAVVKGFASASVPDLGLRHYRNEDYGTTNMVYSLFCAEPEFDRELVVSYGDILYSEAVLRALLAARAPIAAVTDLEWKSYFARRFDNPYLDAESLTVDGYGRICSIGQRDPDPADVEAQYIGLLKFDPEGLAAIRAVRDEFADTSEPLGWGRPWRQAYMTDLLQELIRRGTPVRAVQVRGGWCEIDSLRDFELAREIVPGLGLAGAARRAADE